MQLGKEKFTLRAFTMLIKFSCAAASLDRLKKSQFRVLANSYPSRSKEQRF